MLTGHRDSTEPPTGDFHILQDADGHGALERVWQVPLKLDTACDPAFPLLGRSVPNRDGCMVSPGDRTEPGMVCAPVIPALQESEAPRLKILNRPG